MKLILILYSELMYLYFRKEMTNTYFLCVGKKKYFVSHLLVNILKKKIVINFPRACETFYSLIWHLSTKLQSHHGGGGFVPKTGVQSIKM